MVRIFETNNDEAICSFKEYNWLCNYRYYLETGKNMNLPHNTVQYFEKLLLDDCLYYVASY